VILAQLASAPQRLRVGLKPTSRTPVRGGTKLFASADAASPAGVVTSGTFGPSADGPVSMGYVPSASSAAGQVFHAEVRGNRVPVEVTALPFVPHRYRRS
jgi:aminomethyltransferase